MADKLKTIRTAIKTAINAIVADANYHYTWSGKVEIDRKAQLSEDENLYANIRLGNLNLAHALVNDANNQWERLAAIDIEIEKGDGTLTDDEILDAVADIERVIKPNQTWSDNAILTDWLGTDMQKDQQERTISSAIIHLGILYQTADWLPE